MRDSRERTMTAATTPTPQRVTSTTEALRQAIAVLGYRAPVAEILAYARQHFGVGTSAPAAGPEPARKPIPRRGKLKDRPAG